MSQLSAMRKCVNEDLLDMIVMSPVSRVDGTMSGLSEGRRAEITG